VSKRWVLILAAAALAWYFVPKMIDAGIEGYRTGSEIRERRGR
jgi:hypothetical protein